MNLPTLLTLFRILSVPLLVLVFYLPVSWNNFLLAGIFCIAAMTDWLDGYLARSWNQETRFGAFLDPVADKLMVAAALVLVINSKEVPYIAIPSIVIIGREIVVSALREWMAEVGERAHMAVTFIAKVKTTVQMLAIILLLLYRSIYPDLLKWLACGMLYFAALLTLWSMIIYLKAAMPHLTAGAKRQ